MIRAHRSLARTAAIASVALLLGLGLAVLFGTEDVSFAKALAGPGLDRVILFDVRAPRVALAALCGGALSLVGAAYQGLLRNPLAEPFVLGVSGGSALGASIAIVLGIGALSTWGAALVPLAAFAGGLGTTALVYFIAQSAKAGKSGTTMLLAGILVNAIASALVTFLKALVTPSTGQALLRWLTGFVDLPSVTVLLTTTVYVAAGSLWLLRDAGRLNVLALGDEAASSLGVDVPKLEKRVFLAASLVVGAIVSVTGLIGFVGLVVPHAVRRFVGADQRAVLPLSFVVGALGLVACDLASRLLFRPLGTELPVGAVTAMIGGPIFLVILRQNMRS